MRLLLQGSLGGGLQARTLSSVVLCVFFGCELESRSPPFAVGARPSQGPGTTTSPSPTTGPTTVTPAPDRSTVELPPERLKLLPFEVRMKRLAAAVDLPVTDAVFGTLRGRATDLGAHDYANGVAPDLSWTGRRMAVWIEGVVPVCADNRVRNKYPDWAASMDDFALRAWGRHATPEDAADVVTPQGLGANETWRANCVALLSSVELLTP